MKQFFQTPEEMKALKEMCKSMVELADNHPDFNHISVRGFFVEGNSFHTPYAMIYLHGLEQEKKSSFVSLCNTYRKKRWTMFGQVTDLIPSFDSKEMEKFVEIVSGNYCDIHTRHIITYHN